jgi:hypothetical protein
MDAPEIVHRGVADALSAGVLQHDLGKPEDRGDRRAEFLADEGEERLFETAVGRRRGGGGRR